MSPFQPSYRDGKSAARLIVELAQGKPYEYIIGYEEIAEQLGIDADDLSRIRSCVARAKPVLLREHMRALEAVPMKGYKILPPGQNARLAVSHRRKSDRQIKKAIAVVQYADEADMAPAERNRNRQIGMALNLLYSRQRETETRVSRLEALMLGKSGAAIIPGEVVADEAGGTGGVTEEMAT